MRWALPGEGLTAARFGDVDFSRPPSGVASKARGRECGARSDKSRSRDREKAKSTTRASSCGAPRSALTVTLLPCRVQTSAGGGLCCLWRSRSRVCAIAPRVGGTVGTSAPSWSAWTSAICARGGTGAAAFSTRPARQAAGRAIVFRRRCGLERAHLSPTGSHARKAKVESETNANPAISGSRGPVRP